MTRQRLTEEEEEIEWAREALLSGELNLEDIIQDTGKPGEYWAEKLGPHWVSKRAVNRMRRGKLTLHTEPKKRVQDTKTLTKADILYHMKVDKLTQSDIARMYNVSRQYVWQLKNRNW